ncbi:4'-phosphopantetheinyl transferase superfamily protein [uncultured Campylobacter sp.]|uniref:4'-phosphopantetheinyl transferase superfamily protein n=1 Tax=uncultured Campylobacter sp. TaxID=218934 RepID=UPI00262EC7A9|nr:4'-phosphopantetheinyl transferase superfamily protein [uncultured Campylobacter sp.]
MSEIKILITDEDLCAPRRLLSRRDKKLARARAHLREFRVSRALKARFKKRGKFCISHKSADGKTIVTVGFARQKFGLDLEILKPRNFAAASEFCFNAFERELLAAADESKKTLVFYKIYTIKEALIKVRSLGFYALARVGLARGAEGEVLALDERGRAWHYKSYILEGEILISLVFRENF